MTATIAPITALLLGIALLLMGNGLQGTLLPIRADIEAFSTASIGVMQSAYFIGFAAGCVIGPHAVRRVGHIRAFTAMVAIASTVALVHALIVHPAAWWPLRAITGFCFAALYMIIESWLNERATNQNRGLIFSIYTIVNLTVTTLGQLMVTLYDPAAFPLFILASILVSIAAVPVALTTSPAPAPLKVVRIRIRRLFALSHVGFVGCLAVGLANSAFWGLGPVFAQRFDMTVTGVAVFMSAVVLGGAAGQWPLGRASDMTDRRKVVAATCVAAALIGLALALTPQFWRPGIVAFGFVFGLVTMPVYSVCVAHTNDFAALDEYVEVASGLLLVYGAGAIVGPIAASVAMAAFGPAALFVYTAAIYAAMAAYATFRLRRRARAPAEERVEFTEALQAAQTVAPMYPGAETDDDSAAASPDAGSPDAGSPDAGSPDAQSAEGTSTTQR